MTDLTGKTIVITGAARGQGAAFARELIEVGARVFVTDVLTTEGEALVKELGPLATFVKLDVSDEADWTVLGQRIAEAGGLDGLVNNAAIYKPKTMEQTTTKDFVQHIMINQLGSFLGMKFAETHAKEAGASIVNVSSIAGLKAATGLPYVGTKWALRGMTKAAALELGPRGIRVNSIHPGIIDTKMLDVWDPEDFAARVQKVPLHRAGLPVDTAHLVRFLLSDDSSYISGAEIAIDGGLSL
jgi:3alpha(or 20beta)-hydroxysteroid dehydrogenase